MLFVLKEAFYHVYIKGILFFIFRFSDNHGHKSLPTFQTIINTYITQDNVPPLPPQSMLSHRPSITTQSKKLQALVQLHGILNEPYFEWSFWMILLIYQNNLDCGGRGDMGENNSRLILFVYNHTVVCKVIYHQFRHESRFGKDILTMIVWKLWNEKTLYSDNAWSCEEKGQGECWKRWKGVIAVW